MVGTAAWRWFSELAAVGIGSAGQRQIGVHPRSVPQTAVGIKCRLQNNDVLFQHLQHHRIFRSYQRIRHQSRGVDAGSLVAVYTIPQPVHQRHLFQIQTCRGCRISYLQLLLPYVLPVGYVLRRTNNQIKDRILLVRVSVFNQTDSGRKPVQLPHIHEYLIVRKMLGTYLKTKKILRSRYFFIHFFHTLRKKPGCFLSLSKHKTVRKTQYENRY